MRSCLAPVAWAKRYDAGTNAVPANSALSQERKVKQLVTGTLIVLPQILMLQSCSVSVCCDGPIEVREWSAPKQNVEERHGGIGNQLVPS